MNTMASKAKSQILARCMLRALLVVILITMIFPLIWNVLCSFKTNQEYLTSPYSLPSSLQWDNYVRAFEKSDMFSTLGNSLIVVLVSLVTLLFTAVPCSYTLSRIRFPGSRLIQGILIAGLFVSDQYILIPLFIEMKSLHLLNNLFALALVYTTYSLPFSIFLLTGYMQEIPKDYIEAAILDGCSQWNVLRYVVVPMSKANIMTIALINVLTTWSEYPVALVMLSDPAKKTFSLGIAALYEVQRFATDWGALFAALVIAMLPTFLLFVIGEKHVVKGMSIGGLKG